MKGSPHPPDSNMLCKSGQITTDGGGVASILFKTPFRSPGYAILLTCKDPADTAIAMWDTKLKTGFNIKTENDQGNNEASVTVDWLAYPYYDR